jgi:hypothetical protein
MQSPVWTLIVFFYTLREESLSMYLQYSAVGLLLQGIVARVMKVGS